MLHQRQITLRPAQRPAAALAARRLGSHPLRTASRFALRMEGAAAAAAVDGMGGGGGGGASAAPEAAAAAAAAPRPPAAAKVRLVRAEGREQLRAFAALTREYYEWLGEDLCFQGIDQELASLPGCYAPPGGCIILAYADGGRDAPGAAGSSGGEEPVGCVAVRPLSKEEGADGSGGGAGGGGGGGAAAYELPPGPACEMKRLYVRGGARGARIGASLAAAAVEAGRELGYKSIVLDTLERLTAANRVYQAAGFRRRGAYYYNPLPNVVYWELDL